MKKGILKHLFVFLLIMPLLLTACHQSNPDSEPEMEVIMPFSLCLSADDLQMASYAPSRRVMGDPGKAEQFLLPRYAYIFILKQDGDDWVIWQRIEQELTAENWLKESYSGRLMTEGDSVYRYTDKLRLLMVGKKFNGRVYAIASAERLTFNQSLPTVSDLSDVLNLSFVVTDDIQRNVQHIYSTPYNYLRGGQYYGSFSFITQRVPSLDLLLYHVAAKVDIKWNVQPDKRINLTDPAQAVRLTSLSVNNLFSGNCLAFRPLENTLDALPTMGYDISDIVTTADESLWWEGRYYFYTILYTLTSNEGYFPLQLLMRTNGTSGTGYNVTLNMQVNTSAPFVPWLRSNFSLSKPLADESIIKTVAND